MYNKYITQIFYAKHVLYVGYTWDIRGIYVGYMRVLCEMLTSHVWDIFGLFG